MHDTNRTLYYPLKSTDDSSHYERSADELVLINERETIPKVLPYYHGSRTLPEKFAVFHDNCGRGNILNDSIKKDVVWVVLNDIKPLQEEQPLIGSWTPFNRKATSSTLRNQSLSTVQSLLENPHLLFRNCTWINS